MWLTVLVAESIRRTKMSCSCLIPVIMTDYWCCYFFDVRHWTFWVFLSLTVKFVAVLLNPCCDCFVRLRKHHFLTHSTRLALPSAAVLCSVLLHLVASQLCNDRRMYKLYVYLALYDCWSKKYTLTMLCTLSHLDIRVQWNTANKNYDEDWVVGRRSHVPALLTFTSLPTSQPT